MLDTPRTLRDVLMQAGIDTWILTWPEGPTLADANSIAGVSLDALIGCQGRVVYTEEDVGAMAKTGYEAMRIHAPDDTMAPWDKLASVPKENCHRFARAAITTAGGVVAEYAGKCPVCDGRGTMPKPYGTDRDRGRTFYGCPACCLDPYALRGTGQIAVLKRKEE